MREELEKANEFLNEEDKKKKEYFILSQENENIKS